MPTNCSACQSTDCIPASGTNPTITVVSESPINRRQLDAYFSEYHIPLDYQLTSVVKRQLMRGEKPEADEIRQCTPLLTSELVRAKFILLLGAVPLKAVTKKAKITESIGKVIEQGAAQIMPCFSPSYILRDPSKEPEFRSALKRFSELVNGTLHQKTDLAYEVIGRHNLEQFLSDFESCNEFVYDLETTGLDWYHPDSKINCMGMHLDTGKTYVLPIAKAPTLPADAQRRLLERMVAMEKRAINHNIKFDSLWIRRKFGLHFYTHFDTMLAHHLLDENSPHGLKQLARYYLNAPDYDLTTDEKKGNVDANILFKYCAWDTYYTYELKKIFVKELMKDLPLRKLFYKMVMPAARMMEYVESVGHYVDVPKLNETRIELQTKLAVAEAKLNEFSGKEVNWNSPKQVAEVLFTDLKLVPKVFTDKGLPSTGEPALAELDAHPIKALLMEYRGHAKQLSTYIDGWQEFMVKERLYLGTKLHGTVTGRWSSRLHQVPRDGSVRNLITAPPGWTFVQADLSQAEVRVIAMASQDPELIDCYRNNIDVHWRTAMGNLRLQGTGAMAKLARETVDKGGLDSQAPFGQIVDWLFEMGHDRAIELDKRWKEIRKQAKATVFGLSYGMGAKKFTEYAKVQYDWDVSIQEAEQVKEAYFSTYSRLAPWHERQRQLVRIDGFVRNLAGRIRRLPGIWSSDREVKAEAERLAINSPIQGFIGDYKVMAMLAVYEGSSRDELQVLGEVHDSVLMWIRDDCLDRLVPQVKQLMEHPPLINELEIKLPVPIIVDIEIGRWGAGKLWHAK